MIVASICIRLNSISSPTCSSFHRLFQSKLMILDPFHFSDSKENIYIYTYIQGMEIPIT
ncbi:hypothetical protein Hanom_Chr08g00750201 [Helianthus anomalus]